MRRARLARLERLSPIGDISNTLERWCAFMDAFTDNELAQIAAGRAGRALMRRFAPAGRLEVPPELVEFMGGPE